MQWFLHVCILCTRIFNGLIIFFASYVFLGTKLGFGSRLANKVRSSLKLLSDHPNFAFTIRRWSMKRNTVHSFPQLSYIRPFAAFFSVSKFSNPLALPSNTSAWRAAPRHPTLANFCLSPCWLAGTVGSGWFGSRPSQMASSTSARTTTWFDFHLTP
jgi:hypothetical protein